MCMRFGDRRMPPLRHGRTYTEDLGARICKRIEETGCGHVGAAHAEGVNVFEFLRWGQLGVEGREPYATLRRNVAAADARWREAQAALAAAGGAK